ncbi:MAG: hypothetical protein V4450_07485 [Bacteroidota bacterium]
MKKTIFLAITATMFITAAFSQKESAAHVKKLDTLNISSAKFSALTIDSISVSIAEFKEFADAKRKGAIALYVPMQWILDVFGYLRTSKNGEVTDIQMERQKAPLIPWVQAFEQAQQRSQQPKN